MFCQYFLYFFDIFTISFIFINVPDRGLWHSAQLRGLPDSQASLFQYFLYFNFHLAPPAIGCAKIAIKILILLELCPFM